MGTTHPNSALVVPYCGLMPLWLSCHDAMTMLQGKHHLRLIQGQSKSVQECKHSLCSFNIYNITSLENEYTNFHKSQSLLVYTQYIFVSEFVFISAENGYLIEKKE